MKKKESKPVKVYVVMMRTGKKESKPAEPAYFFTKKELDDAIKEMEKDNIEFYILVGKK
jgi:hypothetical protein